MFTCVTGNQDAMLVFLRLLQSTSTDNTDSSEDMTHIARELKDMESSANETVDQIQTHTHAHTHTHTHTHTHSPQYEEKQQVVVGNSSAAQQSQQHTDILQQLQHELKTMQNTQQLSKGKAQTRCVNE